MTTIATSELKIPDQLLKTKFLNRPLAQVVNKQVLEIITLENQLMNHLDPQIVNKIDN